MRSSGNKAEVEPLKLKQKLIIIFFFLEILIYPFIVAHQLESGGFEPDPANNVVRRGFVILFVWVPLAVILGFLIGRKVRENPEVIRFFHDRDVSPEEVAPIVGIFAPLAIVTAVLLFWLIAISLRGFVITIPIYLFIRWRKKKGLRAFVMWCFRVVLRLAIRMKRISYIGYVLPFIFGSWFANGIIKNAEAQSGGTLILLLIQMVVLIALWRFIRKPIDHGSTTQAGQPVGTSAQYPAQQMAPSGQAGIPPSQQPLPQVPLPSAPLPVTPPRTLPQTPPQTHPIPTTPPMQSRPVPTYQPRPPVGYTPSPGQPSQQQQPPQMHPPSPNQSQAMTGPARQTPQQQQQNPYPSQQGQQPVQPQPYQPGPQQQQQQMYPQPPRQQQPPIAGQAHQPHHQALPPQNLGSGIPPPKKKKGLFRKK